MMVNDLQETMCLGGIVKSEQKMCCEWGGGRGTGVFFDIS